MGRRPAGAFADGGAQGDERVPNCVFARRVAADVTIVFLQVGIRKAAARRRDADKTVGFPSSSGAIPATPVTATDASAGDRSSAPSAIAHATSSQAAPFVLSSSSGTPSATTLFGFV